MKKRKRCNREKTRREQNIKSIGRMKRVEKRKRGEAKGP
jgi:hypothetical protein